MALDRNGYAKSIMPTKNGVCFLCGLCTETVRHEVYGGANREISKANGFWVNLCPNCHRKVHEVYNRDYVIRKLKKPCELIYQTTHTREQFKKLIGEYYDG